MNERKGWLILCLGASLFFGACIGVGIAAFLWSSALMEGILN